LQHFAVRRNSLQLKEIEVDKVLSAEGMTCDPSKLKWELLSEAFMGEGLLYPCSEMKTQD